MVIYSLHSQGFCAKMVRSVRGGYTMTTELVRAKQFFMLARERYNIMLRKNRGEPWPWTEDTHFQTWRFTNIFREDDRTTRWFRENIRDPLDSRLHKVDCPYTKQIAGCNCGHWTKLVESTMIFRWFNRVSTNQILKDMLLGEWNSQEAKRLLRNEPTVFTGAYIVIGQPFMPKLDGVLAAIENAIPMLPGMVPNWGSTLEGAWLDIKKISYLGGFMAHEIVQDLRYTQILEHAIDIDTWGNLGPGAIRGISWLVYGHGEGFNNSVAQQKKMLALMAELLEMSRDPENWPAEWPKWEMHQVEFLLCETAKYFRSYNGYRQKRRYQQ